MKCFQRQSLLKVNWLLTGMNDRISKNIYISIENTLIWSILANLRNRLRTPKREKRPTKKISRYSIYLGKSYKRALKHEKLAQFIEAGHPGEKLRVHYENLIKALKVPKRIYDAELDSIMGFVESTIESTSEAGGKITNHDIFKATKLRQDWHLIKRWQKRSMQRGSST